MVGLEEGLPVLLLEVLHAHTLLAGTLLPGISDGTNFEQNGKIDIIGPVLNKFG